MCAELAGLNHCVVPFLTLRHLNHCVVPFLTLRHLNHCVVPFLTLRHLNHCVIPFLTLRHLNHCVVPFLTLRHLNHCAVPFLTLRHLNHCAVPFLTLRHLNHCAVPFLTLRRQLGLVLRNNIHDLKVIGMRISCRNTRGLTIAAKHLYEFYIYFFLYILGEIYDSDGVWQTTHLNDYKVTILFISTSTSWRRRGLKRVPRSDLN